MLFNEAPGSAERFSETGRPAVQGGESYFNADRVKSLRIATGVCTASFFGGAGLITSAEVVGVTGIIGALGIGMGFAGCIAFGTATLLPQPPGQSIADLWGFATPLGLIGATTGAVIDGKAGMETGRDLGAFINDTFDVTHNFFEVGKTGLGLLRGGEMTGQTIEVGNDIFGFSRNTHSDLSPNNAAKQMPDIETAPGRGENNIQLIPDSRNTDPVHWAGGDQNPNPDDMIG